MNYGELKTAIAEYLQRTDQTTQIIGWITRAEQRIGRDARLVENRVTETVTPSSGVASLPTRFAEIRRISTGSGTSLRILIPVGVAAARNFGTSGEAMAYSLSGTITVYPSADTDLDIDYYEYPEPLAGAGDGSTRPILDRFENLYINAAMAEASLRLQDAEMYQLWAQRYTGEIQAANKAASEAYTPRSTSAYSFFGGQPGAV
jgi:hypothetical protein